MEINNLRKKILLIILLFSAVFNSYSLNQWDIRIEPDILALSTGFKENLNHLEFMEAALYFSGADNIPAYMEQYRKIINSYFVYLEKKGRSDISGRAEGELLLEYLHEEVFTEYDEFTTTMDLLFDKGLFNCVSSGILYYAAAEAAGLNVEGVLTSDHAFCRIITDEGAIDVETTTVYGFNPGEKKEFEDSFGKTGFVYTPPGRYSKRKIIGKKDFIALILQNRIAKLQKKGNFTDTVPLSADRYYILNNSEALEDMLNEFKNFCVVMNNRKKYSDALAFLECVYAEYGYSKIISDTASTLFRNSIIDKLADNQTAEAYDFYNSYSRFPLIPPDVKSEVFYDINEKELYLLIQKGNFRESMNLLEQKRGEGKIPDKVYYEYYVYLYSSRIEKTANSEGWVSALDVVNEALEKSDDERLLQLKKAVIYNIGVIYHNRFADYYNRQDYKKAEDTVKEGLEIVPDDRKLLNDLKTIKKIPSAGE